MRNIGSLKIIRVFCRSTVQKHGASGLIEGAIAHCLEEVDQSHGFRGPLARLSGKALEKTSWMLGKDN